MYADSTIASDDNLRIIENAWLRWAAIGGAYLALTLFFYGQAVVAVLTHGGEAEFALRFWGEFFYWGLWALLTPLILWYARRYRIERPKLRRGIFAHIGLAVILAPLHDVLWRILMRVALRGDSLLESFDYIASIANRILVGSFTGFYKYWLIVALYYAFDYYHKYRRREKEADALSLQTAELQSQLKQAELDALKMQLHPHFLFNTLNTISVLMSEDVSRANRMLLRLSDLLRATLEQAGAHEVTLRQEIDFIRKYLDIVEERFSDRLTVEIKIPPELDEALVPHLILQPLVENALEHGLAPLSRPGTLSVTAHSDAGKLILMVSDNGIGLEGQSLEKITNEGIGLTNTKKRLLQRFPKSHRLDVSDSSGKTVVTVEIPLQYGSIE